VDRRTKTPSRQRPHWRRLAHLCRLGATLSLLTLNLAAQSETQPRGWGSYFGTHRLSKHWGFHFDGQFRASWADRWDQLLIRPGLNFWARPDLILTVGHAYIRTTPAQGRAFGEQRIWEQLQWMPKVRGVTTTHRFRQEQRFVENTPVQDRFRYFFRTEIPLKGPVYYWALQNEIFVKAGRSQNRRFYDQNRAYTAFGKRFGDPKRSWGRLEAGYMYQHVLLRDGIRQEHNNILVISFLSGLSRKL
jgi:hypothetical protein